jgi:SPP1 gp7 family putative phage head morphogenesis protein
VAGERIEPVPDRFQIEAWLLIQQDLIRVFRRMGIRAYRLGVSKAEAELGMVDLFDPRAQAFIQEFGVRGIRSLTAQASIITQRELLEGIRQGRSVDEVRKSLDAALMGRVGTTAVIARTEMNRAANWGRFNGWRKSNVVRSKEFVATLDDRVEPDHLEAHGEVVPLDEPFTRGAAAGFLAPPLRPNCRCTIAPVTMFTPTNESGTEVPEDVEAAEELAEERGIDLAVAKGHVPGVRGLEDDLERELAEAWRRGVDRIVNVFLQSNR